MRTNLPSVADQQLAILKAGTAEAIAQLQRNLQAPKILSQNEHDEASYPRTHLLREDDGWEAPHPNLVRTYFRHFQQHFPEYGSDAKLARLLGLSSDRRIREFKQGTRKVPYDVWRTFLVISGRAPQEVLRVLAIMLE